MPTAVYQPTSHPAVFESTALANAGWYEQGQHGGALAALVAGYVEGVPALADMAVSRITLEFFRVVRIVPLRLDAVVLREGKRIQMVEVRVTGPDGEELSRALVQRLRVADVGTPGDQPPTRPGFPGPEEISTAAALDWGVDPTRPMFHRDAVEVREAIGAFGAPGPATVWIRLRSQVVAGLQPTPLQRLMAAADFCNGMSRPTLDDRWVFMNPDLTVHVNALPDGDWVALAAESHYHPSGRGIATGRLWDRERMVGRASQTLFVDRRG